MIENSLISDIMALLFLFWSVFSFFVCIFFWENREFEECWKRMSRRQKIFVGIIGGPCMLFSALWSIFIQDTGRFWEKFFNFILKMIINYYNMLK